MGRVRMRMGDKKMDVTTSEPSARWHDTALGKIAIGVIVGLILLAAGLIFGVGR